MGGSSCSAEEYITGDGTLHVCTDFDCEDWEEHWLNSLTTIPIPILVTILVPILVTPRK